MTLQQLRYVVEIEKTGSITKSAANLFMSQPNLSNALKDLEAEIGATVFVRTSKGVEATEEGMEFLSYAKSILAQIDRLEFIFKDQKRKSVTLNIACLRSSYVTKVLCDYYNHLPKDVSINLKLIETTSFKALEAVASSKADLGRIVFAEQNTQTYQQYARKNRLIMELLWKVQAYILVSVHSPLAKEQTLTADMLSRYTRVVYSDVEFDILPSDDVTRFISVSERGTMMDVLSNCTDCYLWTISTHPDSMKAHNLVAKPCQGAPSIIEATVYSKDKPRTKEMQWFLEQLKSTQYAEYFQIQEQYQPDTVL